MPTQVTYESNHIFLFLDSMTPRVLNFFFFFYQFFCNLEEKLIVKEWLYIREISITVLRFAKNQARLGPYDKKIKLPLPYETKQKYWQRGFNINFYQLSLRCDYYKLEDLLEIALR